MVLVRVDSPAAAGMVPLAAVPPEAGTVELPDPELGAELPPEPEEDSPPEDESLPEDDSPPDDSPPEEDSSPEEESPPEPEDESPPEEESSPDEESLPLPLPLPLSVPEPDSELESPPSVGESASSSPPELEPESLDSLSSDVLSSELPLVLSLASSEDSSLEPDESEVSFDSSVESSLDSDESSEESVEPSLSSLELDFLSSLLSPEVSLSSDESEALSLPSDLAFQTQSKSWRLVKAGSETRDLRLLSFSFSFPGR
jgi:hypothetical protein